MVYTLLHNESKLMPAFRKLILLSTKMTHMLSGEMGVVILRYLIKLVIRHRHYFSLCVAYGVLYMNHILELFLVPGLERLVQIP